jgi:hypothetical protein
MLGGQQEEAHEPARPDRLTSSSGTRRPRRAAGMLRLRRFGGSDPGLCRTATAAFENRRFDHDPVRSLKSTHFEDLWVDK